MISHALQASTGPYRTVLPWTFPVQHRLRPYAAIGALLRAPIRVYSGSDCGSCGAPIDRDGVCKCSS